MLCFVFFYGATITSFLCLAAERLPHQLKWREDADEKINIYLPSRCDSCNQRISWLYLIPVVGYLLCGGKCKKCGSKVSILYPLAEFFCGLICVSIFYASEDFTKSVIISGVFLTLFFLSLIDIKETWLPACVTIPLFWIGLLFS
ncbi:prepilin peptidase, partial [Escherichia coli]|nr:prepilin peptidase [Escherichia coli]